MQGSFLLGYTMHPPIEYILFDLDNTLYSARWGLEQEVSRRVNDYIAAYLNMSREEAWAFRKERITAGKYGTTLEWLRAEMGFPDSELAGYFACLHPEDEADNLVPDPGLRPFLLSLASLGISMGILTNSVLEHAQRILNKLGVADIFPIIFDMWKNDLKGKPDAGMYRQVLKELGVEAPSCLLVDDVPFYIEGFCAIGGTGVYLDEDDNHPEFPGLRIRKLEELCSLCWPDGAPLLPPMDNR
ncbi:MAG: HAD-IA family hydrolase [Treponema sp.]|nr:HAD-IA family hydrolase [Treponema sp.]